jgi:hypothetical protein
MPVIGNFAVARRAALLEIGNVGAVACHPWDARPA